jgi:hypothetical protein
MIFYRLTFESDRAFDVEVASVALADAAEAPIITAMIYRVTGEERDQVPFQRSDGTPFQILATDQNAAIDIARHVLTAVIGSTPISIVEHRSRPALNLAG